MRKILILGLIVAFGCQTPKKQEQEPVDQTSASNTLPTAAWQYIQVDSTKAKWGDFAEPEWLRYFGLDAYDLNGDGFKDIITGRNVYLSPGDGLDKPWQKIDLGMNVDAMLALDVNNNGRADLLAEALPNVYHLEATDETATAWEIKVVAQIPPTSHSNGQGYRKAQMIPGGKMEVLLSSQEGIYLLEIPENGDNKWKVTLVGTNATDEGFAVGDIDNDGDLDIVGSRRADGEDEPTIIVWFANPGDGTLPWPDKVIGKTVNSADRIELAELTGDNKIDVVVSEERYPGLEPDANMQLFVQQQDGWASSTLVTQYSMNNLDVADIDKDGDTDIITSEHKGSRLALQLWINDGSGKFSKQGIDQGKEAHLGTRCYDMDEDGDLDIVSIGWDQHQYVHVWRNDAL